MLGEACKSELGNKVMNVLHELFNKYSEFDEGGEIVAILFNLAICLWDGAGAGLIFIGWSCT